VLLRDGGVVQSGAMSSLLQNPKTPFAEAFVQAQRSGFD